MSKKQNYTILVAAVSLFIFFILGREAYNHYQDQSSFSGPSQDQDMANETLDQSQGQPDDINNLFLAPIDDYPSRVTKKTFGTYVEPGNSPVFPEKFTGFHSAIDLETFENEQNTEVEFTAICDGELALKRMAQGYGGVVAQYCTLKGEPVTVIYGHVTLSSIPFNVGDQIEKGQRIGILGEVGVDTDNERKHLHLGIRKGHGAVILGYVPRQASLSDYIDPRTVLIER
ncbi:MAG TPA: M23 family metallopeptidase [Candidatus Binatia bacterium]|nr:M23 family metallopeptidase [Candidatus Binatia bacterium]